MTTFIKILLPIILFIISNDLEAKTSTKQDKKVKAKCHVVLVGGNEAIKFWRIQPSQLSKLPNQVEGKKVSTHKSLDKIKVYRAFECVLEGNDFTSLKARTLDQNTPR